MSQLVVSLIVVLVATLVLLSSVPLMLIVERRGSAFMQRRVGPNRVGPFGFMQPLADALKLIFKEQIVPDSSNKKLFNLAPVIGLFPPFIAFAAIPFAQSIYWEGIEYNVQAIQMNVGLLFLLAVSSLHVFSILCAGWSSNNKFSLLGALRASSQMISYEIAIGVSIVSVVMTYGSLDLSKIVMLQQSGSGLPWWAFITLPLPFLILWISSFAETNRLPFDLPEGETELVAGYHSEYSGLKWALFFLGEYCAMIVASAFLATLFLGGYNIPFLSTETLRSIFQDFGLSLSWASILTSICQFKCLLAKIGFFMWVFVWVRWTLPRFRYDQLMKLGWKVLFPLAILNVIFTMLVSYFAYWGSV